MKSSRQMKSAARLYAVQALFQMEAAGQGAGSVQREFEDFRFGAEVDGEVLAEGDVDLFRKLLAAGLSFVLGLQTILIIAGVIRILPVTGITLPFMSYGGSSLVANMAILALLARISHEERA